MTALFGDVVGDTVNSARTTFRLKLYIADRGMRSLRAIDNLQRICDAQIPGQYELTIIDVREHPAVMEQENITWTPVVVREFPLPRKRALGDLTEVEAFITGFDLYPDI